MTLNSIPKVYDASVIEPKWTLHWKKNELFRANNNSHKTPFTIMMPPPNVTGKLHMGHALQGTIQDTISRIKRMQGYEVLWLPGVDHAGIATQNVVEKELKIKHNTTKDELGRDTFLSKMWQWKEKYGEIITTQYQRLGISCDWSRERFTLDKGMSNAVQTAFIKLHEKGYIYRGSYLVNWCPKDKTALSDEEVIHEEQKGKIWYIRYKLDEETQQKTKEKYIVIATTRPETIPADTAIAVHPEDNRYKLFVGGFAYVPIGGRKVSIISHELIRPNFGTGALKVTPGHDKLDYQIGKDCGLDMISVINEEAVMNKNAYFLKGLTTQEARKKAVHWLQQKKNLLKEEQYQHQVVKSSRSKATIEYLVSDQWFVKMNPLAKAALVGLDKQSYFFYPKRWEKTYRRWLENIHDWVVSRQLWWGHRIPVWYYINNDGHIDKTKGYVVSIHQPYKNMVQDKDTLDTWFSSWLWPFSSLGWPEKTKDFDFFWPTSLLVSGYDIIFFWVARMVMAGYEFLDTAPFQDIFLTGMIKDKQGRWMSKSLGNGIDPLDMIHNYGADAVRFCLVILCAQGQDIKLDPSKFEMGRNFINKLWNSFRFFSYHIAKNYNRNRDIDMEVQSSDYSTHDCWMEQRLSETIGQIEKSVEHYRLNEALLNLYSLFWEDFCSWYIEFIKPILQLQNDVSRKQLACALVFFDKIIRLLHPYIPFVTEEIWHLLNQRKNSETLAKMPLPVFHNTDDNQVLAYVEILKQMVRFLRNLQTDMNLKNASFSVVIFVQNFEDRMFFRDSSYLLKTMINIESIEFTDRPFTEKHAVSFVTSKLTMYVKLSFIRDKKEQIKTIVNQIDRLEKHLQKVELKLNNPRFLKEAKSEIIEKEYNKQRDITKQMESLRNIHSVLL